MSNFHFGVDDYDLNYYPPEASDGMGGVDWDKVERVEIEGDVYAKERTCELHYGEDDDGYDGWYCDECGGWFQTVRRDGHLVKPKHCQECGKAVKR